MQYSNILKNLARKGCFGILCWTLREENNFSPSLHANYRYTDLNKLLRFLCNEVFQGYRQYQYGIHLQCFGDTASVSFCYGARDGFRNIGNSLRTDTAERLDNLHFMVAVKLWFIKYFFPINVENKWHKVYLNGKFFWS